MSSNGAIKSFLKNSISDLPKRELFLFQQKQEEWMGVGGKWEKKKRRTAVGM